jgi:hypothetical protein
MGILALLVGGADTTNLILQIVEALGRSLDRAFHFVEKVLEFIVGLFDKPFKASDKPDPYKAPSSAEARMRPLVMVGVLTVGCALALGGARYTPHKH